MLRPKSKLLAHLVRSFFIQFSKVNRVSLIAWQLIYNIATFRFRQEFFWIIYFYYSWSKITLVATFIYYHSEAALSTSFLHLIVRHFRQLIYTITLLLSLSILFWTFWDTKKTGLSHFRASPLFLHLIQEKKHWSWDLYLGSFLKVIYKSIPDVVADRMSAIGSA